MLLLVYVVVLFPKATAQQQHPNSVTLTVTDFEGDINYSEFIRQQLAQSLSLELKQFTVPVLTLSDRDENLYIYSEYRSDTSKTKPDISLTLPEYRCKGLITTSFISARIIDFPSQKVLAEGSVANSKQLEKAVKKLAQVLIEDFLSKNYSISLTNLGMMGIRVPQQKDWSLAYPDHAEEGNMYWVSTSSTTRALLPVIKTQKGQVKLPPIYGIKPKSFQLWKIKAEGENPGKLIPLRHSIHLQTGLAFLDNVGANLEAGYQYHLNGKVSVGFGVRYLRYQVSATVESQYTDVFQPYSVTGELVIPAIQLQYQHYFSEANLISGVKTGVYLAPFGGALHAFFTTPRIHWLRLEVGAETTTLPQTRYTFAPNAYQAIETSNDQKSLFPSVGISIHKSF